MQVKCARSLVYEILMYNTIEKLRKTQVLTEMAYGLPSKSP
jgi:hypothetical protein